MLPLFRTALVASALVLVLAAAPALAATEKFTADLTAAAVGASDTSTATGSAAISFDTKTKVLTWTITYKGLTGKATAAHFHGPAAAGASAAPEIPLKGSLKSPIKGHAKLTAKQITDLEAEMLYLNIHTAKYPDGEIRGQVLKAK
jgi:hypothetical protein